MKKIQKMVIFLFLSMVLIGCQNISSEKQVSGIMVDSETLKTSYDLDTFDISSIKLIINYDDHTNVVINLSIALISEEDLVLLSEPGTHNITINYLGLSTTLTVTLVDEVSLLLHIYNIGVDSGVIVDLNYDEWIETIRGEQGLPGEDGREVTFRISTYFIQWKYEGETEWINLIPLTSLVGPQGDDGADARQVEIRVNNEILQWKYVDGYIWTNLYDLALLQGAQGETGLTPYIGENGNWFVGEVDTNVPATGEVANMDRIGTDGLYFDLTIRNGIAGYEVVSYSGTETDIIVPNEIFGQKVISIKQGALPTTITSISLSKYTEVVPSFQNYLNLESIDFNNAPVKNLPINAFRDAKKLKSILNYSNLENIGDYAFYNTMILFNEFDFTNIVNIGHYSFYVSSVANLTVNGVIIIQENNQYNVSEQTFIYLPETVMFIGENAFPSGFSIYYGGDRNTVFNSAMFFKNVKKTDDGYWYVDRNTYVGLLNYTGELTELNIPNQLDGKSVNAVENYAFIGNNQISRINLPSSITSIGNYSFILTRQLYILHIPSSIVNISNSYFGQWLESSFNYLGFTAPVIVFENNQVDMNFGTNTIGNYGWGRYAFGYSSNQIQQDENFVYLEKTLTAEILAIKNASGKVIIPATYNSKPIARINQFALIGSNGGVSFIDISNGVEYISTYAFYASAYLRIVNIPISVSAVNYLGFYGLPNLEIHVKATEKPSNWDSTWYNGIKSIIWDSSFEGEITADGLYLYTVSGNNAAIVKYFGLWNSTNPIVIPESINGYTVTTIESNAFTYTSSVTTLEVVIPNTVTVIKQTAFTYYINLIVYSNFNQKPAGWHEQFGYSYYWSNSTDSYRTYYWDGTWTLINGDPTPL